MSATAGALLLRALTGSRRGPVNRTHHTGLQHDVYMAVVSKNNAGLSRLLEAHPDFSCDFTLKGQHVLALAVEKGDLDTVQLLLGAGAPPHPEPPPTGAHDPPVPARSQMPACIAIRLNKWAVFEELVSRGWAQNPQVLMAAGWQCLVERRVRMLERLLQAAEGTALLEHLLLSASGPTIEQAGARKVLARCLPLLVASDLDMSSWRVYTWHHSRYMLATDQRALPLLSAVGCEMNPYANFDDAAITSSHHYYATFAPPRPLQALVRTFLRRHLTGLSRYSALCRRVDAGDGGAAQLARQLGLPLALLNFVFMVNEREEFLRNRDDQVQDRLEVYVQLYTNRHLRVLHRFF